MIVHGLMNYDDGVNFAAAIGLVHGQLPYRDFLLLHPPGIVLALSPFAGLAQLTSDATGFVVARIVFMVIGGINAVLVDWFLRPVGRGCRLVRRRAVRGLLARRLQRADRPARRSGQHLPAGRSDRDQPARSSP